MTDRDYKSFLVGDTPAKPQGVVIPVEWLQSGAVVPVTPDTVRVLLDCVRALQWESQFFGREAIAALERESALAARIMELAGAR